jgi:hypothetical protein
LPAVVEFHAASDKVWFLLLAVVAFHAASVFPLSITSFFFEGEYKQRII